MIKVISAALGLGLVGTLGVPGTHSPSQAPKQSTTSHTLKSVAVNPTSKILEAMSAQVSSKSAALAPGQHDSGQFTTPGNPSSVWGYTGYRLTDAQVAQYAKEGLIKNTNGAMTATSSTCAPVVMNYTFYHKVTNANVTWYEVTDHVVWQFPANGGPTTVDSALAGESANFPYQTTASATSQYGEEAGTNYAYANAEGQFYQLANAYTGPARSGYAYLDATFNDATVSLQWIDGFNPTANNTSWTKMWYGPWPC